MGNILLSYALAAALVIGMAGYAAARLRRFLVAQWFLRAAWQWLSGWRKDGRPGRGQRAAARSGGTVAAVGLAWSWMVNPQATGYGIVFLSLFLCIFAIWQAVHAAVSYRFRRVWLRPLHKRLAPKVGVELSRPPQSWIKDAVPGASVRLEFPAGFTATAKEEEEIARVAAYALAIESPEPSWQRAGPKPKLALAAAEAPPPQVTLADVRADLDQVKPDELVWGRGKRRALVTSSLSGDSPHLGLSMASGAGKSVTARALLAQMLYRGCIGLILDYKMISHQWARDLPNVVIARRPHEIHAALLWLGREAERRNEVALAGADMDGNVHAVVGPRLIVVCEELNATVARLRAYWRQIRDRDDPVRSPALDALDAVSFMGRQVLMNVIYIGQRLSVKASGGDGDARENISVVAFGRYSASNWKMLAGDHPMPPKSLAPGRIQVVDNRVRETQAVFPTAAEARQLALAGTVATCPAGMPGAPRVTDGGHEALSGPGLGGVTVTAPVSPPGVTSLVTISQAVREGTLGPSHAAVKQAKWRDSRRPEGERVFPAHRGLRGLAKLYDPAELAAWDAGRR